MAAESTISCNNSDTKKCSQIHTEEKRNTTGNASEAHLEADLKGHKSYEIPKKFFLLSFMFPSNEDSLVNCTCI